MPNFPEKDMPDSAKQRENVCKFGTSLAEKNARFAGGFFVGGGAAIKYARQHHWNQGHHLLGGFEKKNVNIFPPTYGIMFNVCTYYYY